jgi:hypothetical protein
MSRLPLFLPVVWLLVPLAAPAQTPDTATIQGHILDQTGAAVPAVEVAITNELTGFARKTQTEASGSFSFSGLPIAGKYRLTAVKQGFAEAGLSGITLSGGATARLSIRLNVADMQSRVTVTGVAGEVRSDQPQLGERLDARQIEELPLLGRKITYLPLLNAANHPAINQGDVFMNQNLFTTNGSGRRQTSFVIDGVTGNDSWGRQTLFTNIPLEGVQEMTVLENAFSAEYGASMGGVVNIVTKSGGNAFHGEFLELWRPSATEARLSGFTPSKATSGNQLTNDTLGQSALSLSGPIGKGAWFLVSGEFSRENRASPVTSPIAPGEFVGHYREWPVTARLDRQINDANSLFFRGSVDGYYDTNPNGTVGGNNLPSVDRVFRRRTYSAELGETAALSPTLLNNARLQFQLGSPITQFDPVVYGTQYVVPISTGGTFTSGTSQSALLMNRQYEAGDTLSAARGRHQLKFGFDVLHSHNGGDSKEYGGPIYLGQFSYNTCTGPLSYCESSAFLGNIANVKSYTQSYGSGSYTVDDTLWAAFVQDDFRFRPDLTFNLGLRYERQTYTDAGRDFAPRVGFAYDLRGKGNTVVRGGFGIYYAQVVDNEEASYVLTGPTGVFNYTAAPGQVGFPASVSAAPLPAFPAGAVAPLRSLYIRPGDSSYYDRFFPTSVLNGYPAKLLNPYSEQWSFGVERQLKPNWVLSADYVGSHSLRVLRPLDLDAPAPFVRTAPGQMRSAQAANCTRPYWIWWYQQNGGTCGASQPPYSVIQSDVNNGFAYYDALNVNLSHSFSKRLSLLASYTWSHAIDNVDPDVPGSGQNPNDPNFTGSIEKADAIFDQRQRFVLSGVYMGPLGINFGGMATLGSGLPYNIVTGVNNSGDTGATADRPVINGVVIGRNTGRGNAIYDFSPFLERDFSFNERVRLLLRAESLNVLNHANFVGYSGTYGNGAQPGPGFGQPLTGITNQLPARSFQFSLKLGF